MTVHDGLARFAALAAGGSMLAALAGQPALAQDDAPAEEEGAPPAIAIGQAIDGPFFVTWLAAAVRAEPDGGAERLATLDFGDHVFVTGRVASGPWYRVELDDGQVGYVWVDVLAPLAVALPGGPEGEAGDDFGEGFVASADNNLDAAQPLGVLGDQPVVRQAWVGPQDVSDFYSFEVGDWTEVTLTLEGLQADADITLLDLNGDYLTDSAAAGPNDEFIATSLAAGSYYVEVYMYDGETPYTLTVSGVPGEPPPEDTVGNEPATASDLGDLTGASAAVSEWVGPGDGADVYSFTVTARSTVAVTMQGLSDDADISLEDDFGTVLASSAEGGSNPESMQAELEPGQYYIVVVPFSGSTYYDVEVTVEAAGPAPEDGAGNSVAAARPVALVAGEPQSFEDWVGSADPSDFYVLSVDAPGGLVLGLSDLSSDVDVELLDGDGETVLESSLNPGAEPERIEWPLTPGTYYVRVYIFSGQSFYRLSLGLGS